MRDKYIIVNEKLEPEPDFTEEERIEFEQFEREHPYKEQPEEIIRVPGTEKIGRRHKSRPPLSSDLHHPDGSISWDHLPHKDLSVQSDNTTLKSTYAEFV